jgi:uncharacterized GH25 family protein
MPLDDLLSGDFGTVAVDTFDLVTPTGKRISLPPPSGKRMMPEDAGSGMTVEKGDLGIRKLQFTKDAPEGTYQVCAASAPSFFTQYLDKKGKQRTSMKPLDEVKDAEKIIYSVKYMSFAKSIFGFKGSTEAKPLGDDLEIIPLVDVTDIRTGDLLPIKVMLMGKPLSTEGLDIQYVTASSNTFGGPDKFALTSFLFDGKAQFRMPTPGEWLLNIYVMRPVDKDPSLAHLKGKAQTIIYAATLNVTVKP